MTVSLRSASIALMPTIRHGHRFEWISLSVLILSLLTGLGPNVFGASSPRVISVASAADLSYCIEDMVQVFTNRHPRVSIGVTIGSSGSLFTQIYQGAPIDLFLSGDMEYPRALTTNGLAEASSLVSYAIGSLVLWTARTNLPIAGGLATLTNLAIRRVAMPNPEFAPYGRAAREALQSSGLWNSVEPRLLLAENVSQTAQFVQSGQADAGLLALSIVTSPRLKQSGIWFVVPERSYRPMHHGMVLTKRGQANSAARQFYEFLRGTDARVIFDHHGFRPPSLTK